MCESLKCKRESMQITQSFQNMSNLGSQLVFDRGFFCSFGNGTGDSFGLMALL